ncbi:hypothetical protein F4777DRAFT_573381 [Nemania sp. FL0916]|nr:hypothetical protein F4777DRAFT_573381 [Nemania sp. FL0916]
MKLTAALGFLALSTYVIAAPLPTIPTDSDKLPGRADLLGLEMLQKPLVRLPAKTPTRKPNKTSGRKASSHKASSPKASGHKASKQPLRSSHPKSPAKPRRKPNPSYIASLAHRLTNKSPFSESSFVREETLASTEDWEPEATIVEWETKASRDASFWIPCFSADKTIHYRYLRVNTDMLVVCLVLSLIAIILIIELWRPVAARLQRLRSGHGPICLDSAQMASKEDASQILHISYESVIEPHLSSQR